MHSSKKNHLVLVTLRKKWYFKESVCFTTKKLREKDHFLRLNVPSWVKSWVYLDVGTSWPVDKGNVTNSLQNFEYYIIIAKASSYIDKLPEAECYTIYHFYHYNNPNKRELFMKMIYSLQILYHYIIEVGHVTCPLSLFERLEEK